MRPCIYEFEPVMCVNVDVGCVPFEPVTRPSFKLNLSNTVSSHFLIYCYNSNFVFVMEKPFRLFINRIIIRVLIINIYLINTKLIIYIKRVINIRIQEETSNKV